MLVGLLGFIGSGKGAAGEILVQQGFHQLSFASSVKDVVAEMFGWPRDLLEGHTDESRKFREVRDEFWSKEFGREFTPRLALQLMGTEVGRNIFHEDFWVIKVKKEIQQNKNYVITDVRFPNEMNMIRSQGGVLIEIQRGLMPHWYNIAYQANHGEQHAETFMKERIKVHESEWRWITSDIDHVITNEGTMEELKEKLLACLTISYGESIIEESIEGVLL